MIGSIVNLVYPAVCQACDKKTGRWNQGICEECLKKIRKRRAPFCAKCGRQLPPEAPPKHTCPDCEKTPPYYDRALSGFCYEGVLKELVHTLKYGKMTSLAGELARLTVDFMAEHGIGKDAELILSIPMHPNRLLKREVNFPSLLADDIAGRLGLRHSGRLLKKTKDTPPQSKLKRPERIKNIKDSFALRKNKGHEIRDKNILLVDDLFTTGSTANECARTLKMAGAGRVEVITLARGGDRL